MLTTPIFSDDILIRLLQAKHQQDTKFSQIEACGLNLDPLRIDLLTIALDAMGLPPEDSGKDYVYWTNEPEADEREEGVEEIWAEDTSAAGYSPVGGDSPTDDDGVDTDRDWIWDLYAELVREGSCEEVQAFLAAVRNGCQE